MSTLTATAPAHFPERHRNPNPNPTQAPRQKPASRPDHLRVVRPSDRRRARLSPGVAVVLTGLLFALLFAVAIAQTILVEGQVRLDTLDTQLATEQARYRELRKDVAEGESPERIVAEAKEQGMVAPTDLVYLQPSIPDAAAAGDDPTVEPAGADPETADGNGDWAAVKPLLEAPAP